MNRTVRLAAPFMASAVGLSALAETFVCPPMPKESTTLTSDVKVHVAGSLGRLGPIKAADLNAETGVVAKAVFKDFPGIARLSLVQTMSATYCEMLRSDSKISSTERLDRWERFQTGILKAE